MTDELRAAANRLRDNGPYDFSQATMLTSQKQADLWTVWEAWSADHPADDGEPVTEEWLASTGRRCSPAASLDFGFGPHGGSVRIKCRGIALPPSERAWCFGNHPLPTRGHVRRLLAALGVTPCSPDRMTP